MQKAHRLTKLWIRTLKMIFRVVPYWTTAWAFLLTVRGLLPAATVYLTKLTIDTFIAARDNLALIETALFLPRVLG